MKTKITFVVPEVLQNEFRAKVTEDGYGFRGKSKWVSEAVERLFSFSNYPDLVQFSEEMQGFEKVETVVISPELKRQLDEAILETRKQYPTLEGVQSSIVRTAIMQRLLRS